MLRGAKRHGADPYMAYSNVGFRCVIQPGFSLPGEYDTPTPNKHHIPNKNTNLNGNDPGDPGDNGGLEFVVPPMECPEPNSKLHATVFFKSDDGSKFTSLEILDGNNYVPFVCSAYDQNTHTYDCVVGPLQSVPANPIPGKFCYKDADQMNICVDPYPLFTDQGCTPNQGGDDSSILVHCVGGDKLFGSFLYDRPVTWESYTIGNGIPMNCTMYPPRLISCVAPAITTNGLYQFRFEGFGQDGDYLWTPEVVPQECSKPDEPWAMNYAWCDGTNVKMYVLYTPETAIFDYATVDGNDILCAPDIPNRLVCSLPPNIIQGTTVPSKVCLSGNCVTENLVIPKCTPTAVFPKLDSFCDDKGAGLKITFPSAPSAPISKVEAGGQELTCQQDSPTVWSCRNLPGQPGDSFAVKITLADWTFIYPGQYGQYPKCEADGKYHYWSVLGCQFDAKYWFATDVMPGDTQEIVSAELDGQMLVDELPSHPYDFAVSNLVLNPGDTKSFKVCYTDGSCRTFIHQIPKCSQAPDYTVKVDPFCDAKGVGIHIHFDPAPPSAPTTITANGLDLNCGQNSPTDWTCGGLPGQPNDPLAVKIYYQNSPTDLVNVVRPFCEGDIATWSALTCNSNGSYFFATDILPMTDANKIISVELNGQQLVDELPNAYWDFWVEPLTLNAGDTLTFKVCYADGTCRNFTHVVPECAPQVDACHCRLMDVQCLSETKFSFIVQTCSEDPKLLEPGSVSGQDSHGYACDLIPSFDGRVYCAGPNPDSQTPLTLTYKRLNDALTRQCTLDSGWPPSIPACPTPVPTGCAAFTTYSSCFNAGCEWTRITDKIGICK